MRTCLLLLTTPFILAACEADADPAAWLAAWLAERAGIRELDGGADREAATTAAWHDLLTAAERGEPILYDPEADHD